MQWVQWFLIFNENTLIESMCVLFKSDWDIFCCLLKTFANSLDPDQAQQNVGPDLDPNCLTLWKYSWKNFLKKLILKKSADGNFFLWKITQHAVKSDYQWEFHDHQCLYCSRLIVIYLSIFMLINLFDIDNMFLVLSLPSLSQMMMMK